ncbi:hypothetical protein Acr_13g0000060 [Actinidia rufa]|uniref:Integrase catalytic domain-containing protein n=1 Tax=Actinidia rufa TaxID=165716 RepID=A0A7J0FIU0_9ERIC|nr:hypothetical protein Acr_13g0000060 [Actinidia rufa]
MLFVDGSSNQQGCGAGLVLQTPSGDQMEYAIWIGFKATNNEAEYEALLAGLQSFATSDKPSSRGLPSQNFENDSLSGQDALANLASSFDFIPDRSIPLEFLASPSIGIADMVFWFSSGWQPTVGQIPSLPNPVQPSLPYRDGTDNQPWPFTQQGIDILGPLPQTPRQRKFLIVAIAYFTKWMEAQPIAKITEKNTTNFIWKHVIFRFKIQKIIISDNARQFDNDIFKLFCSDLAISHHFSSPGHPQANGQVKVTNRSILRNLKARVERSKSEWVEELPSILWAYRLSRPDPTHYLLGSTYILGAT